MLHATLLVPVSLCLAGVPISAQSRSSDEHRPHPAVVQGLKSGLRWLVDHQRDDGSHSGRIADTAMATLTFLGSGSTNRSGPHKREITRAAAWLQRHQWVDGRFWQNAEKGPCVTPLSQAMATMALADCAASAGDAKLLAATRRALSALEKRLRRDGTVTDDYQLTGAADASATFWTAMARWRARAAGLRLSGPGLEVTRTWMWQHLDSGFFMRPDRTVANGANLGPALLASYITGVDPTQTAAGNSALAAIRGVGKTARREATLVEALALFQHGGRRWDQWQKVNLPRLGTALAAAAADANHTVMEVAMGTQTLQVPWRYPRMQRQAATATRPGQILVKSGDKIAFLGDSITQAGARGPAGYCRLVIRGLAECGIKAEMIPAGISGHKSNQMLARLDRDVLQKKPDWMTLSCGVNDVWHGKRGVPLDQYKKNITAIVDRAQAAGIKVMILTATMIREDQGNQLNQQLAGYNEFLRNLATDKECQLADLNAAMQAALVQGSDRPKGNQLTTDGVHMNALGNIVMALGVLRGFGLSEGQAKAVRGDFETIPDLCQARLNLRMSAADYRRLRALATEKKMSIQQLLKSELEARVKRLLEGR